MDEYIRTFARNWANDIYVKAKEDAIKLNFHLSAALKQYENCRDGKSDLSKLIENIVTSDFRLKNAQSIIESMRNKNSSSKESTSQAPESDFRRFKDSQNLGKDIYKKFKLERIDNAGNLDREFGQQEVRSTSA